MCRFRIDVADPHVRTSGRSHLSAILLVQEQGEPLVEFEPRLVVPRLQRSVMAEDLMNDGQHVVRPRAVVRGRISAATARRAHRSLALRVVLSSVVK